VFSVFVGAVIYPIYANWTWGGGWLAMLGKNLGLGHGHVEFRGVVVVHMTGGVMAFVTAALLGRPRNTTPTQRQAIRATTSRLALIGTFISRLRWFGFNAGSTLAGSDLRIGVIATNTCWLGGRWDHVDAVHVVQVRQTRPSMLANGTLAGLVAITARARS